MQNDLLKIDTKEEVLKIGTFIKDILLKQNKKNVVIGVSSGIDSVTALYLLKDSVLPENIYVVYLPYFDNSSQDLNKVIDGINLPPENIKVISIKPIVDSITEILNISDDKVRRGNIMARVRMIALFDFAKKIDGLVCGTENKSEHLLGYFTRFGDEASDFEPLQHLYKTQVYEIAEYLKVPRSVINKQPSANLWENQTDEKEFGFSYKEADSVLYLYFDKKMKIEEIEKQGFKTAKKIIDFANRNAYKHKVPYGI